MIPIRGPWTRDLVEYHLDTMAIPVRLSFLDDESHPRVLSLWFERRAGHLWCATQHDAVVAEAVERDDRVGFEVAADEPPYRGVRGRARARIHPDLGPDVLASLIPRYLDPGDPLVERLLAQTATEVAIEIIPDRWDTWDYSGRMATEGD